MGYDPQDSTGGQPAGGFGGPPHPSGSPSLYGPARPPPVEANRGATVAIVLVVGLGLLLAGGGIFAVLGVYGTRKYIAAAKSAEARSAVARIAKQAAAAYEDERLAPAPGGAVLPDGTVVSGGALGGVHELCPSAHPVPANVTSLAAKTYLSTAAEWQTDPGWSCLRFEVTTPQRYQYSYASERSTFSAVARGDLNGDGIVSTFELRGRVEGSAVAIGTAIVETKPEE